MKNSVAMSAVASMLVILAVLASTPVAAQAATRPTAHCAVAKVILHGKQPVTANCLRITSPTPRGVAPATWQETGNCWGDLILYQDAQYGGSQICFAGSGSVNLTNYAQGCFSIPGWGNWCWGNWNDQVSSFQTGNTYGHFAWDINDAGAHYPFSSNNNVQWIGHAWNDQISSLTIDGPN